MVVISAKRNVIFKVLDNDTLKKNFQIFTYPRGVKYIMEVHIIYWGIVSINLNRYSWSSRRDFLSKVDQENSCLKICWLYNYIKINGPKFECGC